MELKQYNDILVSYQRNGNDKNGNPVYLVNIFKKVGEKWDNVNNRYVKRLDKNFNIRIKSYNIESDINSLLS